MPPEEFTHYKVRLLVNNTDLNGPELIEPLGSQQPREHPASRGSAHEYWPVDPAALEADIGRIVVVAHVFRDRERPYRRIDATAQADRDLILGLEQSFQSGVRVRERARAEVALSAA